MVNCIVIDDEQFSVDVIITYIELTKRIKVKEVFLDPKQAIEKIEVFKNIDVLFMDINMPDVSGIELAKTLRPLVKKLVFTTSHTQYAFEAYQVEGDAYLLKPFTFGDFMAMLNRLFPPESSESSEVQHKFNGKDYFLVKNKDEDLRIEHVLFAEVVAFESLNNYIKIYLANNRTITSYLTIQDILELLGSRGEFKQFHRSYVIAVDHISYIASGVIKMSNNLTFPVGDRFKSEFHNYVTNNLAKTSRNK
ncbi:LytR/AlgR family response regulator transcription factor [Mucilaginibacter sp. E4BP6]|uniref:LytR/AlgR family response regulator transcription factor n=1 Tax=Mucilaginibacter sp. E4BP6 TaxID=2723089 RepID=UPI0015C9D477|nr:LytTR family DNA-binding domain-containing protein [Mucilaginibacter sp. E4BP6]NYE65335.1 DNA-binding LytR/AlgR family response regulator [Mucilaginibacter sp. E4BP6]